MFLVHLRFEAGEVKFSLLMIMAKWWMRLWLSLPCNCLIMCGDLYRVMDGGVFILTLNEHSGTNCRRNLRAGLTKQAKGQKKSQSLDSKLLKCFGLQDESLFLCWVKSKPQGGKTHKKNIRLKQWYLLSAADFKGQLGFCSWNDEWKYFFLQISLSLILTLDYDTSPHCSSKDHCEFLSQPTCPSNCGDAHYCSFICSVFNEMSSN